MSNCDPSRSDPNLHARRRIIAVTGGIAMGKTTVSNYLAEKHGLRVLDADAIARDVVVPGSEVLDEIVDRYGTMILLPDGTLDRVRLGEIIFNSAPERHWLEQKIHPQVRDRFEHELEKPEVQAESIVVLVIPLLFEARMTDLVTEIWVVTCPQEQQIERLLKRQVELSGRRYRLDRTQAKARIQSQMPIERKIERADAILDNSSTPDHLFQQVEQALARPPQEVPSCTSGI